MIRPKALRLLLIAMLLCPSLSRSQSEVTPELKREFRGVWIATVGNIDWPSRKNMSSDEQKKEFVELLDMCGSMNFNAVIVQIRPSADAFYDSSYEPWSRYLTGLSGEPPMPYYDPLAFLVEETHRRGMEFHAWINPYRAVVNYQEYQANPFPLTYEHPEWFVNYGKNKYFDPGVPEVRAYTLKVINEVVKNYDIDAIHLDDYFYPYKLKGEIFQDDQSFEKYGEGYYPEHREEWRRQNVNMIIQELRHEIKSLKPWVQFGVSPFGVWRNGDRDPRGSATYSGQTNYDDLYADITLWMKNGWLDYILPQAYWHIGHLKADYREVVKWWSDNSFGTRLYIGHSLYKMTEEEQDPAWHAKDTTEIEKQLLLNKSMSKVQGSAFFSASTLRKNPLNVRERIARTCFPAAILPAVVDDKVKRVPQPVYEVQLEQAKGKSARLTWQTLPENKEKEAVRYLIQLIGTEQDGVSNAGRVILTGEKHLDLSKKELKEAKAFVIRAVSRNNDVSDPVTFEL